MFLVPQLSYVVTVLFRRVSQIRIRWLLHFSFESAALIHHIMMLAHSTSNEVAGLFVVGRLLHVVGKAVVTYEHDDVVWLV